jgi:hypothetical protein
VQVLHTLLTVIGDAHEINRNDDCSEQCIAVCKPYVVYWAEGVNQEGNPVDAVVDIDVTDELIPVLVDECHKTPKASFWQKIKQHF